MARAAGRRPCFEAMPARAFLTDHVHTLVWRSLPREIGRLRQTSAVGSYRNYQFDEGLKLIYKA